MVKVLGPNDKIISGLAAASALAAADLVPVVQGGVTEKATVAQLATYIGRTLYNASITTPASTFNADTYLVGSDLTIAAGAVQARTMYKCRFSVSKTNVGTATPILTVRFGTLGTVSDLAICTFTFPAQTAVVDEGLFEVFATFRAVGVGTTALMTGAATLVHDNASAGTSAGTGLSVQGTPMAGNAGAGFNSTTGTKIGLSVNGGASAVWTVPLVQAELINLP